MSDHVEQRDPKVYPENAPEMSQEALWVVNARAPTPDSSGPLSRAVPERRAGAVVVSPASVRGKCTHGYAPWQMCPFCPTPVRR